VVVVVVVEVVYPGPDLATCMCSLRSRLPDKDDSVLLDSVLRTLQVYLPMLPMQQVSSVLLEPQRCGRHSLLARGQMNVGCVAI